MDKMPWFDLVRGLAALAVCAGHLRNLLFKDFAETGHHSIFQRLFYFLTGQGHQAVILFFVLSGCLVGGAVWKRAGTPVWSWRSYLLARVTRLWIVLIPALVATLVWDRLGLYYFGQSIVYTQENFGHILPTGVWSNGTGLNFVGNLFFLQTIIVPTFGSNGPLWSLSYEFWYYLIFPALVIAWRSRYSVKMMVYLLSGVVMLCLSGGTMAVYGLIWLSGVLVAGLIGKISEKTLMKSNWALSGAVCLLIGGLAGSQIKEIRVMPIFYQDVVFALLCAPFFVLASRHSLPRWVGFISTISSGMSYSLYLFHLPFMVFICAWFIGNEGGRMDWGCDGLLCLGGILCLVLIYVYAMYVAFEKQTERVRLGVSKVFVLTN